MGIANYIFKFDFKLFAIAGAVAGLAFLLLKIFEFGNRYFYNQGRVLYKVFKKNYEEVQCVAKHRVITSEEDCWTKEEVANFKNFRESVNEHENPNDTYQAVQESDDGKTCIISYDKDGEMKLANNADEIQEDWSALPPNFKLYKEKNQQDNQSDKRYVLFEYNYDNNAKKVVSGKAKCFFSNPNGVKDQEIHNQIRNTYCKIPDSKIYWISFQEILGINCDNEIPRLSNIN